jgi:hypothetical protein
VTPNATTHNKFVSSPSDSGMAPVSWLSCSSKSLQSRWQTVITSHPTSLHSANTTTHVMPVSEPRDCGMAPVSWLLFKNKYDTASQLVVVQVQIPDIMTAKAYTREENTQAYHNTNHSLQGS